jgi:hypothetical protein
MEYAQDILSDPAFRAFGIWQAGIGTNQIGYFREIHYAMLEM